VLLLRADVGERAAGHVGRIALDMIIAEAYGAAPRRMSMPLPLSLMVEWAKKFAPKKREKPVPLWVAVVPATVKFVARMLLAPMALWDNRT
jgi:hypothetical protein